MDTLRRMDIKYLKGIGPKRAELLEKNLGIKTYYDLLHHFPTGYVDRSTIYRIADFSGEMPTVQVKGRFIAFSEHGEGAKLRLVGLFSDGSAIRIRSMVVMSNGRPPRSQNCLGSMAPKREPLPAATIIS